MGFSRANMDWMACSRPRRTLNGRWSKRFTCMALVDRMGHWAIGFQRRCTRLFPPAPPLGRGARRLGPRAHDKSCELRFKDQLMSALLPVADHHVEPFGK